MISAAATIAAGNVRYGRKDNTPAAPPAAPAAPNTDEPLSADAVKAMIGDAVKGAVKAAMPEGAKPGIDEAKLAETVQNAVKAAMEKAQPPAAPATTPADSTSLKKADVEKLVAEAVKAAFDGITRDRKSIFSASDSRVEVPTSWCKGNLPLHGKQLLNILMKRQMNDGVDAKDVEHGVKLGDGMIQRMRISGHMGKALTSTGSTAGDELVPTDLSSELQRRMYLSSNLIALLALDEIDMPSQPYEWPLSKTRPKYYLGSSENTATTASAPETGKLTLDAKKLMAQVEFSYELDEDSIIPVLPWLQTELGLAAAEVMESVVINGDTATTHQDSDTAAIVNASEKGFNGLRKLALAVTGLKKDLATGGIIDSNLRALKKALGKYGVNPENLVLACGPLGQNDMEGMAEVSTVDKLGNIATIITGRLPKWRGVPIVTSAAVREDLNASGVYDDTTKTKGSILLFNRREFLLGRRREFTVEIDRDITKQQHIVVASFRKAFAARETPSATIPTVGIGYNYAA